MGGEKARSRKSKVRKKKSNTKGTICFRNKTSFDSSPLLSKNGEVFYFSYAKFSTKTLWGVIKNHFISVGFFKRSSWTCTMKGAWCALATPSRRYPTLSICPARSSLEWCQFSHYLAKITGLTNCKTPLTSLYTQKQRVVSPHTGKIPLVHSQSSPNDS